MKDKIIDFFQRTFDRVLDSTLGVLFNIWFWLGEDVLDVIIEPRVVTVYQDHPETRKALNDAIYQRAVECNAKLVAEGQVRELQAELQQVKADLWARITGGSDRGPSRENRPKLTAAEVSNVRALHRSGKTQREIADIYDVNPATISRIVRGLYYRAAA